MNAETDFCAQDMEGSAQIAIGFKSNLILRTNNKYAYPCKCFQAICDSLYLYTLRLKDSNTPALVLIIPLCPPIIQGIVNKVMHKVLTRINIQLRLESRR